MMNFYASGQKPAFGIRRQSLSQAPAVEEIHDRVSYSPLNGVPKTYEAKFDDSKTIFEGFVEDANFTTPIADDGRLIGDHWVKGHELRRSTSSYSSTPFPTPPPLWMSSKVRQKGPRSLKGICNMDTISKDNTEGDGARMDNLLPTVGRKVMGIKYPEPAWKQSYINDEARMDDLPANLGRNVVEIKRQEPAWINAVAGPGCRQENRRIFYLSPSSERRPGLQATNNGDSCIHHSDNEDDILSNTSLLPVKQGFKAEGGYSGFVVPNMDGDQWINPTVVPYFTTDREDTVPRQVNGIEIRMKKRKNNTRGKGQKSKKGEIGLQASSRAEVLAKLLK